MSFIYFTLWQTRKRKSEIVDYAGIRILNDSSPSNHMHNIKKQEH